MYSIILRAPKAKGPPPGPATHAEMWWDCHTRLWVVWCLDDRGNQIGEASYLPKESAIIELRERKQAIADRKWEG